MTSETKETGRLGEIQAAINAGAAIGGGLQLGTVQTVGDDYDASTPFMVLPDGSGGFKVHSLKDYEEKPKGFSVTCAEEASFRDYVRKFKDERTVIFAMESGFLSVIDWHEPDVTSVGKQRGAQVVEFALAKDPDYARWLQSDGRWMPQLDFADLLEDMAHTVIEPSAATMLEIAQSLQAKPQVDWKSHQRLQDGSAQLLYTETVNAAAGRNGELEIPASFQIELPLIEGGVSQQMMARLRFRLKEGVITFRYALDRQEHHWRQARLAIAQRLHQDLELPVYSVGKRPVLSV